jgi:hypothetical protein
MGVFDWSPIAAQNASADPAIAAADGAPARSEGQRTRALMAAMRRRSDDQGGAITTTGEGNAYVVKTASGVSRLQAGLSLTVRANRTNTGAPTINVDGTGPRPWLDAIGSPLDAQRVRSGRFYTVVFDDLAQTWQMLGGPRRHG